MSMLDNVTAVNGHQRKATYLTRFIRTVFKMLHPGDFYEGWARREAYASPLVFLLFCSVLFTVACSVFVVQKRMIFALMFFLNAFSMPFVSAFVLYVVTALLCKSVFSYNKLLGITAYANVTLLISWIPGLAGPAEILKFFLIGLGMVKVGGISRLKSLTCLLAVAALMLLLVYLLQPILGE